METSTHQFAVRGHEYHPIGETAQSLPAGFYSADYGIDGPYFERKEVETRDLLRFEDSAGDLIISETELFWKLAEKYEAMGEAHKRGYLLYGPPGSGKTCITAFLMHDFIAQGNLVFEYDNALPELITALRQVPAEKDRKIMILLEDLDNWMSGGNAEHKLLQFLDGSIQHKNTLIVATTNYPEELAERIINRPSRFDRVMEIGMPSSKMRLEYIKAKSIKMRTEAEMQVLVEDSEGFSIAHLKELLIALDIFGGDYNEILFRLKGGLAQKIEQEATGREDYPHLDPDEDIDEPEERTRCQR
jgi:hypothetical protein